MKLHLGCGGSYLVGYTNIDLPKQGYSAKIHSKVDLYADITNLKYAKNSVDEIRLHHVFEHFPKAVGCALVASWNSWLKIGGVLRIEVPDFDTTAFSVLNPLSSEKLRKKSLRHIFGSQEDPWATHYEGWSEKRLKEILELFSFKVTRVKKIRYMGLYSIDVMASKHANLSLEESKIIAERYLGSYLTDGTASEARILNIWTKNYNKQCTRTWGKK